MINLGMAAIYPLSWVTKAMKIATKYLSFFMRLRHSLEEHNRNMLFGVRTVRTLSISMIYLTQICEAGTV